MAEDEADVTRLHKVTFNLKPRAKAALDQIVAMTGEARTDAINDALRLYAMVLQAGPDAKLYIKPRNGDMERIHLP